MFASFEMNASASTIIMPTVQSPLLRRHSHIEPNFQGGESKVWWGLEGALVEGGRREKRVGGLEEEEGG